MLTINGGWWDIGRDVEMGRRDGNINVILVLIPVWVTSIYHGRATKIALFFVLFS